MEVEKPVSHFLVMLVAITAIIVLNGIAYRGVLRPVFAGGSDEPVLSYETICARPRGMDAVAFEEYVRRYEGRRIAGWQGWVRWSPTENGNLRQVDIASELPGDLAWGRDIELLGVPAAVAGQLRWGQQVTFSGTIRQVSIWDQLCTIIMESVTIAP